MVIYETLEYDGIRDNNKTNSGALPDVREATWISIIRNCSTFRAKDCNAEFSEIFPSEIFLSFRSISDDDYFVMLSLPTTLAI